MAHACEAVPSEIFSLPWCLASGRLNKTSGSVVLVLFGLMVAVAGMGGWLRLFLVHLASFLHCLPAFLPPAFLSR